MIKLIQLSAKRSGSTFLHHCLDSHPNIETFGELFVNSPKHPIPKDKLQKIKEIPFENFRRYYKKYNTIGKYLDHIWSKYDNDILSFKLIYNQIMKRQFDNFVLSKIQMKPNEFYVIHLKRRNLVKHVISNKNAAKNRFLCHFWFNS